MKILTPGHRYVLDYFEHPEQQGQLLQFIEKVVGLSGEFRTVNDGTTNEEVLAVLIDRLQSLNQKAACRENSIVLTHLETALLWLNKRTANRKARGVEGTPNV
jgi:hypothetical protein